MKTSTNNRMATPTPKPVLLPVQQVTMDLSKPPASLSCPGCGRVINPFVLRTRPERGEVECECRFCSARFAYQPPALRLMTAKD